MILYADDQLPACYPVGRRADVRELQELISTGVRRRASGGFAPRVVTGYYYRAGLAPYVEKLGFHLVGYGCTTCIGNSGPLIPQVSRVVSDHDLTVCSVLSGNRNSRAHPPECRMNFLASPPLEWWRMRWRAPCTSICCTIHWARTATESGVPARDLAIPGRDRRRGERPLARGHG